MSSKARRKGKRGSPQAVAPSPFFFIALVIGLLMLGFCVAKIVTVPMKPPQAATPAK
jgi:hypothetical protein